VSLLRNTFSADPINPTQPQPIYYALRTLSTALDDTTPTKLDITFSVDHPDIEWHAFERGNGEKIVAIWLAGKAVDDASREHVTDISIDGQKYRSAQGIDSLNGIVHNLDLSSGVGTLRNTSVRDWPFIIILSKS
jgi:hypothetical protein